MRAALLAAVACLAAGQASAAESGDWVPLPPVRREAQSEDGRWLVQALRAAEPAAAVAQPGVLMISRVRPDGRTETTGRRTLDFAIGPRAMLVLDDGRVVLFESWLRLRDDPYALTVLAPSGELLARFSRNELAAALGQDPEAVIGAADPALGTWLTAPPRVETGRLTLPVGEGRLALDLSILRLRRLADSE